MIRLIAALVAAFFSTAVAAQVSGFPPGTFLNRAAIDAPPAGGGLSCSYTPITTATQGTAYTGATPSASGGTPAYTFSETGSLPSGLSISSSTGVISGTPSVSGSFPSIQVKVTDSTSTVANCGSSFTLVVSPSGPTCVSVYDKTSVMTTSDNGQGTLNYRFYVPVANMGAATGNKFRLTLKTLGTSSGSLSSTYFGVATSQFGNFDGNQTQVTWNTGSTSISPATANTYASDIVTFAASASYDHTKDYQIAINYTATINAASATVVGDNFNYSCATSATTTGACGGNVSDYAYLFTKIEICQ